MSSTTVSSSKPTNSATATVDSHEHLVVTIDDLELKDLSDLRLESKINDHVRISFTATVPGETADKESFIKNLGSTSKIVVGLKIIQQLNQLKLLAQQQETTGNSQQTGQTTDAAATVRSFFKGMVTKVDLGYFRDHHRIMIEGISYSGLLDQKLRSRTYQKAAMTYTELVDCILDNPEYSAIHPQRVISEAFQGATIGQLIVQLNVTDWQHLIRMASHRYTGLVANPAPTNGENPEFWFGVPEIDSEVSLTAAFYTIHKKIGQYEEMLQNKTVDSLNEPDFLYYEVKGIRQYLQIGQAVSLNGKKLYVCQIISRNVDDQLLHDYVLTTKDGLKQRKFYNPKLAGTSLTGTVIDRDKDEVKVLFDVDSKQILEEAWLFPQTTPYAAEEHTGWYWMPEWGDRVKVYFPNENEANAYIVSSMRKKGTAETADPEVKYLRTPRRKEMRFDKTGITVATTKGLMTETDPNSGKKTTKEVGSDLTLWLDQNAGITVRSDHTLNIETDTDLTIKAKTMDLSAPKLLELKCKTSLIKMEKQIINIEGKIIDWRKPGAGATQEVKKPEVKAPAVKQPVQRLGVNQPVQPVAKQGKPGEGEISELKLAWNKTKGGVDLSYTVAKGNLKQNTTIEVFWSKSNEYKGRKGKTIFTYTVEAGTAEGNYIAKKAIRIEGKVLLDPPDGVPYLIAVSNEKIVGALKDVQIIFNVNRTTVWTKTQNIIKNGQRMAGQSKVVITSTFRSPADQARIMFGYLVNPDNSIDVNVASQHRLYGKRGDKVINVFEDQATDKRTNKFKTRQQIINNQKAIRKAMEDEIINQGPRNVSRHCGTDEQRRQLNVVDIGYNSSGFSSNNVSIFINFIEGEVSKLIDERESNGCIHIEVSA
jgi:phage baseplate assembly protein gpV